MSTQPEQLVNWQDPVVQEAVIALCETRGIRQNAALLPLVLFLLDKQWLTPDEQETPVFKLNSNGTRWLPALLDQVFPEWRERVEVRYELSPQERSSLISRLEFIKNNTRFDLPLWLNQVSYNSLFGELDDSATQKEVKALLPNFKVSRDQVLRIRGTTDMHLVRKMLKPIRLGPLVQLMSQAIIPERDLHELTEVDGEQPYMVMTVENLSTFMDLDIPDHLMLIWAPLDYPDLAIKLIKLIPHYVPHIHFGDLDASGIALAEQIATETGRPVRRFIPDFWREYSSHFAQPCSTAKSGKGARWQGPISSNEFLRKLMIRKEWLPQNAILLDPRLKKELHNLLS